MNKKKLITPQLKNILAMAAFGTIAIFVQGVALDAMEIAFWRGVIALVVLCLIHLCFYKKESARISPKQKALLFLSGMAVGLNWVLLFMAYDYTSVAVATLAYYFAPVLVIILAPVLFREKMTRFQFVCFAMATLGLALVVGAGSSGGSDNQRGILYGLGAAAFYAAVILMNKLVREGGALERTMLQFAGAVTLLFAILLFRGGFQIGAAPLPSLVNLLVVGVVHTGLCYWLYFSSIRELPGHQTAILSYVDPFVAILVSTLVFREPIRPAQALGAVLILGFTCLYEVAGRRPEKWKASSGE